LLLGLFACSSISIGAAEGDDDDDDERDESIEEVVVTGSHIRRSNFDLPSPIDAITDMDIKMSGSTDIGDVIFDQTYQIGVNANTNTGAAVRVGTRVSIAPMDHKAVRPTPTCEG
jgi:outer membrane cobalamin receptor